MLEVRKSIKYVIDHIGGHTVVSTTLSYAMLQRGVWDPVDHLEIK